jgi:hypothetical protein
MSARAVWVRRALCAVGLSVTGALASAGDTQIYKTVDAHGNIVYSDRASSANAPKAGVQVHEPSAEDLAQVEQQRHANQSAEVERLKEALVHSAGAQQQKEKQTRCEHARDQFHNLSDASRIYQLDAQGNRVYLSDAEADAKRAEARRAMDAACAP